MPIVNYFLISVALLIGVLTAYEDIKFGKIRNKWILIGLVIGIGTQLGLIGSIFSGDYILKVYLNAGIALLLGYSIWRFNGWSAGDAKLFFVFSLLVPLKFYGRSFLPVFPSLVILINTFVPLLLFIFCRSVGGAAESTFLFFRQNGLRARLENGISSFFQRIKMNYWGYLEMAAGFFLAFVVFQLVRLEGESFVSHFVWGRAGLFGLMAFLGIVASRAFKNKKFLMATAVAIALYLFSRQVFYSKSLWPDIVLTARGSVLYLAIFGLLLWLFSFYPTPKGHGYKPVDKWFEKHEAHNINDTGISPWCGVYEKASKSKSFHFALWLFLGLALTIILEGSVISLMVNPGGFWR